MQLYERALQLDPKFTLAAANLSMLHSWILYTFEPTEAHREAARRYAERALQLEPDSPEAHFAQGFFLYYGRRDFAAALQEFAIAERGLPNDAQVSLLMGAIQRRQGRWQDSTESLEKAVNLSPNDTWILQNLVSNYQMLRDYEAARRTMERALAVEPGSFKLWEIKSRLAMEERGDLSVAEKALAVWQEAGAAGKNSDAPEDVNAAINVVFARANVALMGHKNEEVLKVLDELKAFVGKPRSHYVFQLRLFEGIALQRLGRATEAQAAFLLAKEAGENAVREAPNEAGRHANLARALAYLGEKEAALAEAKRATELLPESADAFEGPVMTTQLAEVYAILGENDKAITLFDDLLERFSGVTVASLRLDPALDQLLQDPQFQAVLAKHSRKS